jgi:hypothetical protein
MPINEGKVLGANSLIHVQQQALILGAYPF